MKIKNYKLKITKYKEGQVIIIPLIFLVVVMILSVSLFSRVITFINSGSRGNLGEQAFNLADAGVDYAIYKLNNSQSCDAPSPCTITIGTGEAKITTSGTTTRKITSDGCVSSCTINTRKKDTVKVELQSATSNAFQYLIQADDLDTTLYNGYVNPKGDVYSSSNILGTGTIIDGNAWAEGTTIIPTFTAGHSGTTGATPPKPLPTFNKAYWINQASCNNNPLCIQTCAFPCVITSDIGPRQYNGSVRFGNNNIAIKGPIYITGEMQNGGASAGPGNCTHTLRPDNSLGVGGTVIIADHGIQLFNACIQSTSLPSGPQGVLLFYTDCTYHINCYSNGGPGIELAESDPGINGVCDPHGIFMAPNSDVLLRPPTTGPVNFFCGALLGKKVDAHVYYGMQWDTDLQYRTPDGAVSGWQIKKGTYHQSQ